MFEKLFRRKTPKERAIKLLEESAQEGDLQSQQILVFYRTLDSEYFCPIHSSIHILKNEKAVDDVVKCMKNTSKPIKRRKSRRGRNPKKNKHDK